MDKEGIVFGVHACTHYAVVRLKPNPKQITKPLKNH